jgi:hypothetical protein
MAQINKNDLADILISATTKIIKKCGKVEEVAKKIISGKIKPDPTEESYAMGDKAMAILVEMAERTIGEKIEITD